MFQEEDRQALQELLEIRRAEVSIQVAARAALRVLPLLEEIPGEDVRPEAHRVALVAFRALQIAFAAGFHPDRGRQLSELARSATDDHAEHHLYSGDAAAKAIEMAIGSVDAGYRHKRAGLEFGIVFADPESDAQRAAFLASNAADPRVSDSYQDALLAAAFDDAHLLVNGRGGASLHRRGLWPSGQPKWVERSVSRLATRLESAGSNWAIWIRWYEAILRGETVNRELEYEIATIPREVWRRGAADANREVQHLMDRHMSSDATERDGARNFAEEAAEFEVDEAAEVSVGEAPKAKPRPRSSFGWGLGTSELARRMDDMELQLADLSDRLSHEIEVQVDARRNDPMHVQNIEFLEGLRGEVDGLYVLARDLPGAPDPEATDEINRKGRNLLDVLERYADWVAGEQHAREIANGVLIAGAASFMIQLNWAPLPVTTAAIALIGGARLKTHLEKLIAQVRGAVKP